MSITTTLLTEKQLAILANSEATHKLTRKQAAFVRHLLENPKSSATQAVIATYDAQPYGSAKSLASENMSKPDVLAVLRDASEEAEGVLHNIMRRAEKISLTDSSRHGAAWATVARGSANDILDRVHGKATQRTESISAVVTVNVDLTSMS